MPYSGYRGGDNKLSRLYSLRGKREIIPSAYSYLEGREFDRWIDSVSGSARSNGENEGNLIDCFPYIIESLLRDENFVERDLSITTVTDTTHIIVDELKSSEDDYYNYF